MIILKMRNDIGMVPRRSTEYSAGYDIFSNDSYIIQPGQDITIELPFQIEFTEQENYLIAYCLRSSLGIKKNIRMIQNQKIVPFVLADNRKLDYQIITLRNIGIEPVEIEKNAHFLQFIVTELPLITEEVSDTKGIKPVAVSYEEKSVIELVIQEPIIIPGEGRVMVPTGLKFKLRDDCFLAGFIPVSEIRFRFSNGIPIIDSDYYNNPNNEGHCFFSLENTGTEDITLTKGTIIAKLISLPYYKVSNEVIPNAKRTGGIGSTS